MRRRQTELYYRDMIQQLTNKLNESGFNPYLESPFNSEMYKQMLQTKDNILCSNRYFWNKLLELTNLTSQELESMFYRYGSLCVFENEGKIQISDFAKVGTLTPYGKLDKIEPIDFGGKSYGFEATVIRAGGYKAKPGERVAVIINDYTPMYNDVKCIPRATINLNTTINDQVNVYSQLANNITLSVKKALAICDNEDQRMQVVKQISDMLNSASPVLAVTKNKNSTKGALDDKLEMFNFGNNFDTQNYCQQIDYYDKVRRSFNGVPAPDTFEKKERKLTSETEDTTTHTELVLMDGYMQRYLGLQLVKKYIKVEGVEELNISYAPILDPTIVDDDDDADEEPTEEVEVNE